MISGLQNTRRTQKNKEETVQVLRSWKQQESITKNYGDGQTNRHMNNHVGHGGALVEAITLNRRVVGSTPALAAM